tara:strand:+ start:2807 stop:3964 length:1158 start_codon:yes stop_codon:yes gene_type:complete
MTLSLALKQKGFNVIIVDPKNVKDLIGIDKRTTAVAEGPKNFYETIKVWEKVKKYAEPIKNINIKDGNSKIDLNFDCNVFKKIKNINSLGYVIENSHLLRGINSTIKNNKKIGTIKRIKARVVSIDSDNFSSRVTLSNKKILNCHLVVASDGKNSISRKVMGIEAKKLSYKQKAFVCSIIHTEKHNNVALEKFLPGGPLAILPMKNYKGKHRSSIIWSDEKEISESRYFASKNNLPMIEHEIGLHCKEWLGNVKLVGLKALFPLELTLPKSLVGNRFILMGDAAHSIHPIAGQGFNLTIRDIKIFVSECYKRKELGLDIGSKIFLDNYERKRMLDVNSLVRATHALNKLFENKSFPIKILRRTGLSMVEKSNLMKKYFMKYAMGI